MISIWVKLLAVYTRVRKGEWSRKNNSFFLNACAVASNVFNSKSYNEFVKQQKAQQQQLATVATTINERISASVLIPLVNYEFCQRCQSSCVCGSVCLFALLGRQSALAAQGLILFLVSSLCGLADKPVSIKYLSPRPLIFYCVCAAHFEQTFRCCVAVVIFMAFVFYFNHAEYCAYT